MATLQISAVMGIREANPYVPVTKEQAERLQPGWRRPMPVVIKVNGEPKKGWHINMMPVGDGSFYLYLHGDVRKASGTKVGDHVVVDIDFDNTYHNGPMHPMPIWFSKPLHADAKALAAWRALPPSRQKEVLRYFASVKSGDARARNLTKIMHILGGKDGRFMARDWHNGK